MKKQENFTKFEQLKAQLLSCCICPRQQEEGWHPIFQGDLRSKIFQISQAPSRRVMETGLPFNDASGRKLKQEGYQISDAQFYDPQLFYIASIARCYPGKAKGSGDERPPVRCAELYLKQEVELVQPQLYIVIGSYAAQWLFPQIPLETLIFSTRSFQGKPVYTLPHPSPLNRKWLKDHPDFETNRMPQIRAHLHSILLNES